MSVIGDSAIREKLLIAGRKRLAYYRSTTKEKEKEDFNFTLPESLTRKLDSEFDENDDNDNDNNEVEEESPLYSPLIHLSDIKKQPSKSKRVM